MIVDESTSFKVLDIESVAPRQTNVWMLTEEQEATALARLNDLAGLAEKYRKNGNISEQDRLRARKYMSLHVSDILFYFREGWQEELQRGVERDRKLLVASIPDDHGSEAPPEVDENHLEKIRWNIKIPLSENGGHGISESFALREYNRLLHLFPSSPQQYVRTFLEDRIKRLFQERFPGVHPGIVLKPCVPKKKPGGSEWSVQASREPDKEGRPCLIIAFQENILKDRYLRCFIVLGLKRSGNHKRLFNKNVRILKDALQSMNKTLDGRPGLLDGVAVLLRVFAEKHPYVFPLDLRKELKQFKQFDEEKSLLMLRELASYGDRLAVSSADRPEFEIALFKIVKNVEWKDSAPYLLSLWRGFGSRVLNSARRETFYYSILKRYYQHQDAVRSDLVLLLTIRRNLGFEDKDGTRFTSLCCQLPERSKNLDHPAAEAAIKAFDGSLWSQKHASHTAKALAILSEISVEAGTPKSEVNDFLKKIFKQAFAKALTCLKTAPAIAEGLRALDNLLDGAIGSDFFAPEGLEVIATTLSEKHNLVDPDPSSWITRSQFDGFLDGLFAFLALVQKFSPDNKIKWRLDELAWICSPLPKTVGQWPDRFPASWFAPFRQWLEKGSFETVKDLQDFTSWLAQWFVRSMFELGDHKPFQKQYENKLNSFLSNSHDFSEKLREIFVGSVTREAFIILDEEKYSVQAWNRFSDLMEAAFKGSSRGDLRDTKEYLDRARAILAASGDGLLVFSFRKWAVDTASIVLKRGAGLATKEKQTYQQAFVRLFIRGLLTESEFSCYEDNHKKAEELAQNTGFDFENEKEDLKEYAGGMVSRPTKEVEKRLELVAAFAGDSPSFRRFEEVRESHLYTKYKLKDTTKTVLLKEALFDPEGLKKRLQELWSDSASDAFLDGKPHLASEPVFLEYGSITDAMKNDLCVRVLMALDISKISERPSVLKDLCEYLKKPVPEDFLNIHTKGAQLQMFSILLLSPPVNRDERIRATAWGWASILKDAEQDTQAKEDAGLLARIGVKGFPG